MKLIIWNKFGQSETLGSHYQNVSEARVELEKRFFLTIERECYTSTMVTFKFEHQYFMEAELTF